MKKKTENCVHRDAFVTKLVQCVMRGYGAAQPLPWADSDYSDYS